VSIEGVGVFVGISTPDYGSVAQSAADISPYSATGSALSVAAGRLSYTYGFKGPSVAVDTGEWLPCLGLTLPK